MLIYVGKKDSAAASHKKQAQRDLLILPLCMFVCTHLNDVNEWIIVQQENINEWRD